MREILKIVLGAFSVVSVASVYYWREYSEPSVPDSIQSETAQPAPQPKARLNLSSLDSSTDASGQTTQTSDDISGTFNSLLNAEGSSTQGSGQKPLNQALELLRKAAKNNDKNFLDAVSKMDPNCSWCNDFFKTAQANLLNPDERSDVRAYMAKVLASTGTTENLKRLVDTMEQAANHPELGINPSTISNALQNTETPLEPQIIDQLAQDLNSDNPYLREAAVSILTKQGTLSATQQLYNHTLERHDPDGYYRSNMGLGAMTPQPETIPFLQDLVSQRNEYSHLATKALLNTGLPGLKMVVELMSGSSDYQSDRRLLKGAVDRISRDPATLAYLTSLSQSSPQKAIREMAQTVIKEHSIGVNSMHPKIEYNENFEKGLKY